IKRYFMTIPEAVELVLQAGVLGIGGEIFVLDMGEPINVYDMARHLITLSGFTPDEDVKILITGLRPGEKLTEELWSGEEHPEPTSQPKILRVTNTLMRKNNFSAGKLEGLFRAVEAGDHRLIRDILEEIVSSARLSPLNLQEESTLS
ncbi:polysaccharide biosynthesis protein, partial [candidate division KSB1 bacterium]|nr:polysaccharide biosynthesis protein [candidate division KSB1 bacterium]